MTEQEIQEGNKFIIEFLGWKKHGNNNTYEFPNLYPIFNIDDNENTGWIQEHISKAIFHSSWDWLMPVVEFIEDHDYRVTINFCNCYIETYTGNSSKQCEEEEICCNLIEKSKIEATWKTIIEFIKQLPVDDNGKIIFKKFSEI